MVGVGVRGRVGVRVRGRVGGRVRVRTRFSAQLLHLLREAGLHLDETGGERAPLDGPPD